MDNDIFSIIFNSNLEAISQYFASTSTIPSDIRDTKQSTLLHLAALANSYRTVEFLIQYMQAHNLSSYIPAWLDCQNEDGFTCLLYAIYRGNLVTFT